MRRETQGGAESAAGDGNECGRWTMVGLRCRSITLPWRGMTQAPSPTGSANWATAGPGADAAPGVNAEHGLWLWCCWLTGLAVRPRSDYEVLYQHPRQVLPKQPTSQLERLPILLISFITIFASVCLLCKMVDRYLTTCVNLCYRHIPCPNALFSHPHGGLACSQACLIDRG